jgi:3',5'-cyclic AMP phosphodiesterase CpdA
MIKKFRWPYYLRWLALCVALALLFMGLLLGKGPTPVYGPALHKRSGQTSSDSFCFAFLSDLHKGWGVYKPIMRKIASEGDSFAVVGGDIVAQGRENRYLFFLNQLAELRGKTPIYFAPGNHDVYEKNNKYSLRNFENYFGPDYYWFLWGNTAFVVFNDARSTISDDQFRWLNTTLKKLRRTFTHLFVFMHVPPLDPRPGKSYCLAEPIGKRFMQLMQRYRVDYVFSGHIHCYFRKVVGGVTYIVAPPAGGTPRCIPPFYGYVRVVVQGEELKDSVIQVKSDWWLQIKGDIQYELRVRNPFLLPLLTVVLGQSYLYVLNT